MALDPDDPFVLGCAGSALTSIGHAQDALHPLMRAVRKAPASGPIRYTLGNAYCALGRHDEALASLAEASRLTSTAFMDGLIKASRATVLIRAGRWEEAEGVLDDLLAVHPDNDDARLKKAILHRRAGRDAEARTLFAPLPSRGLPLAQILTGYRRAFVGGPVLDELLDAIRVLWAESGAA